ncbi:MULTISPECIES: hypothetical protein [unclassified Microcoleus]|uniref:hypothetical protein n=1 Tax=unclassified Microcoleus TaxID=2642155 RepID=UPI002FCF0128
MKVEQDGETGFMSTSEFDKYKVDHLFLLVGENPLPNYVAAKTLLAEGGKPYLVFTEYTQKPAERLQEALGLSDQEMWSLDNNESNAAEIKKKIWKIVKEIQKKPDHANKQRFGLNYTGGTKAMAVHAYQALLQPRLEEPQLRLEEPQYKLNPEPIFSYLDSRNLKMLIDQPTNPDPLDIPKEDLDFSLEKLFKLHGFNLSKPPKTKVTFSELVKAIVKHKYEWRNWCYKLLRLEARQKIELGEFTNANNEIEKFFELSDWKNATELRQLALPLQELPQEITNILQQHKLCDENGYLSIQNLEHASLIPKPSKAKDKNKYPKEICKWLEGVWLEDYVLQNLKDIQEQEQKEIDEKIKKDEERLIDEVGMSFNFPENDDIGHFEFDVAFLRGYQLFALSCTTDTEPGLCKLKLFEAYRRARQMGGDEARVALVCCYDKPEKIKKGFMSQIKDDKVNVFGLNDLADLSEKLKTWIQGVDK